MTTLALRYRYNRFPNYGFPAIRGFHPESLGFLGAFVRPIPAMTFPCLSLQNFYAGDNMGLNKPFLAVPKAKNLHGTLARFLARHNLNFGADFGNAARPDLIWPVCCGAPRPEPPVSCPPTCTSSCARRQPLRRAISGSVPG